MDGQMWRESDRDPVCLCVREGPGGERGGRGGRGEGLSDSSVCQNPTTNTALDSRPIDPSPCGRALHRRALYREPHLSVWCRDKQGLKAAFDLHVERNISCVVEKKVVGWEVRIEALCVRLERSQDGRSSKCPRFKSFRFS